MSMESVLRWRVGDGDGDGDVRCSRKQEREKDPRAATDWPEAVRPQLGFARITGSPLIDLDSDYSYYSVPISRLTTHDSRVPTTEQDWLRYWPIIRSHSLTHYPGMQLLLAHREFPRSASDQNGDGPANRPGHGTVGIQRSS